MVATLHLATWACFILISKVASVRVEDQWPDLKLVINSNKFYTKPLQRLLLSMTDAQFKNWTDVLVVIGGADREKIYRAGDITYIETKFMSFDLTGLSMLYHYRDHPLVRASVYLYLLDTSTVGMAFPSKFANMVTTGFCEIRTSPGPVSNIRAFGHGVVEKYGKNFDTALTKEDCSSFAVAGCRQIVHPGKCSGGTRRAELRIALSLAVGDQQLIGVVEDLMKKFPLEKIRMPQTRITDKGVASLLYGLESCPSLVSMQVSGSNLDVQGIIQTLQNTSWRSLRRVHMHHDSSRSGLDVEHTSIRLWGPIVTDVEAKALGAALALSPVEEIDIRDNKEITDEGAVALITPLLESNSSSLRKIDMAFTSIADAGLHVFGETLQSLQNGSCSLKSISVWQKKSHSTFGDEGVASLLRGLERCPNLVYVDAEGPNLRSQTMQNACQALNARWPNLETFYVTYENQLYDLTNYHCQ